MGSIENSVPDTIPTVDISPFLSKDASPQAMGRVVESMRSACSTYGFFYLVGHGIREEDRKKSLDCAKCFFALSHEQKMDVWIGKCMGRSFRGYEPPALQIHKEGLLPDTKEGYILGLETPADDPRAGTFHTGPNQWPKSLSDEEFRIPLMDYHSKMIDVVKVILKVLALGLPKDWNCSPDVFDELTVKPSVPMRLLHYPPQAVKNENQFGVGEHTDFGNVSVLLQEEGTEGLEVLYPSTNTWIPVPVKPGSYVINMGDMMQKWTAGYYRSALHRVVNHNTKPRYSAPFFFNGNLDLKCTTLDGSGVETVVGEHIRQRLMETIGGEAGRKLGL
ncbi:2-oxoglutarate-dependent dioxygenase tropC [Lachnellula suecica]|uniref:2-oxoglutarate-dependent dioxygenase tropC n=1 Tax=Lachnellula suecica TaxID=602035 RepID=A0A8T9CRK8_9HELO|nr:2-oxoglutarate-dependent dioxygenase tropC [Lachnellula suecica]